MGAICSRAGAADAAVPGTLPAANGGGAGSSDAASAAGAVEVVPYKRAAPRRESEKRGMRCVFLAGLCPGC
jgi:hypothetical protein